MNSQLLDEFFMEGPAVFEVESPAVKIIKLIEKENTLQRPADSGQQLWLSCGLPSKAELQDGFLAAGLNLHVRPPLEGLSRCPSQFSVLERHGYLRREFKRNK
jgi:hypothetical protein